MVAWEAIEQYGGIVPEIEEDRGHAPPAWWRYPSRAALGGRSWRPRRATPHGLYIAVAAADLKQGDILVRTRGAGACGKMAILAVRSTAQWMTAGGRRGRDAGHAHRQPDLLRRRRQDPAPRRRRLPHPREEGRHARRTCASCGATSTTSSAPSPSARRWSRKNGRAAVDEKVHDLLDEAWSLVADTGFDLERRELTGRALALGAALDWPGAAPLAAAVLDDVHPRAPLRAPTRSWRARSVDLLAGERRPRGHAGRGAPPRSPARRRARSTCSAASLLASGKTATGLARPEALPRARPQRSARAAPASPRAATEPRLRRAPPAAQADPALRLGGTAEPRRRRERRIRLQASTGRSPGAWSTVTASPDAGLLLDLATGRVILEDGDTAARRRRVSRAAPGQRRRARGHGQEGGPQPVPRRQAQAAAARWCRAAGASSSARSAKGDAPGRGDDRRARRRRHLPGPERARPTRTASSKASTRRW